MESVASAQCEESTYCCGHAGEGGVEEGNTHPRTLFENENHYQITVNVGVLGSRGGRA
jgi:hypothetical protein